MDNYLIAARHFGFTTHFSYFPKGEDLDLVEAFAEQLFWRLDEKHGMLEKQARLYKPFEVFGPEDIDWSRGKIKRLDLLPGATLVASQLTL